MSAAQTLDGQIALVTGAGQGVGRGIALALAAAGAAVSVTGLTLSKCQDVATEITERGGKACALECDVTSRAQVEDAVAATRAQLGGISIVVNAAQSMEYGSIRRLTDEAYEMMFSSGPAGTLRVMQACFEDLRASRGVVINLGSGSGLSAAPAMGGYASVKEAIRTLSRVTAAEWGKYGIRVNVICPLASSPGMDAWASKLTEAGGSLADTVPLGRIGDSEADIGRVAVFLAGPDSGYVTGTTLMVDGGHDYLR